ncbi:hypothetical protein BU23DRAFT_552592 [Bimuria novae-zelandiae CBS 107.79]|uniref:BTB domain-containing protein n=1 Tax=Bimuria novae-zelandiae CBS 107.79 TaxID=1447943 RepID=A0A6A5VDI3_9PLEO|nr:hypothetical protein BU23DRAFT_552592 [Bimuria novae-zelandiae CBS 107.79]
MSTKDPLIKIEPENKSSSRVTNGNTQKKLRAASTDNLAEREEPAGPSWGSANGNPTGARVDTESNQPAKRTNPIIIVDSEGDLILTVTSTDHTTTTQFQVHSKCISAASKKWAEAIDKATGRLDLVDDRPGTIEWVVYLAHPKRPHQSVIRHITFWQLISMAQICKDHKLLNLFRPFIRDWSYSWLSKLLKPGYELWIVVAYSFGFRDIFNMLSERLALQLELTDSNQWQTKDCGPEDFSRIPKPVMNNILQHRGRLIEAVINSCYVVIDRLSAADATCVAAGEEGHGPECTQLALGSVLQGLRTHGIWPERPHSDAIRESVNDFRGRLSQIHVRGQYEDNDDPCLLSDTDLVTQIWESSCGIVPVDLDGECGKYFSSIDDEILELQPLVWEYQAVSRGLFHEREILSPTEIKDITVKTGRSHSKDAAHISVRDKRGVIGYYQPLDGDRSYQPGDDPEEPEEEYLSQEEAEGMSASEWSDSELTELVVDSSDMSDDDMTDEADEDDRDEGDGDVVMAD